MTALTLPRAERLRTLGAIRRLFENGESGFVYPFRFLYFAEADTQTSVRVLFSVPKRFHKRANKRNLLRRRTKEAYRLRKAEMTFRRDVALDLALVYSAKEAIPYERIEAAVGKILRQVAKQLSAQ